MRETRLGDNLRAIAIDAQSLVGMLGAEVHCRQRSAMDDQLRGGSSQRITNPRPVGDVHCVHVNAGHGVLLRCQHARQLAAEAPARAGDENTHRVFSRLCRGSVPAPQPVPTS